MPTAVNSGIGMFMHCGPSGTLYNQGTLPIYSFGIYAGSIPLFVQVDSSGQASSSLPLVMVCGPEKSSLNLYLHNITNSGNLPLYIGGSSLAIHRDPYSIDGGQSAESNFPLYIKCAITEGLNMFLASNQASGNLNFYMQGMTPGTGSLPLVIYNPITSGQNDYKFFVSGY